MKILITILFGIFTIVLLGQEVTLNSSEEYTNQYQDGYWTEVLGQDESGFHFIRKFGSISSEKIILEKYSPDMKLIYAENIESTSGVMGNSKLHRLTEYNNGKIYVFVEGWDKSKKENSFLVKEVDQNGKVQDSEVLLETEYGSSQMKSAVYYVSFSDDGSKLLVLTQKPYQKKTKETIRLQVFNTSDFSSLWKKDLELNNDAERAPKNHISVNNDGMALILKDIQHSWKNHTYKLITVNNDAFQEEEIDFGSYQLGQHRLRTDKKGNLVIGATLSLKGGKTTDFVGTWTVRVNPSGKIIQNKAEPLGSRILSSVVSQNNAQKTDYVLSDYILKDVLINDDNDVLFLTEEYRNNKTVVGQSMPPIYDYSVFYGKVLIISKNGNNEYNWHSVIDKKQKEVTRNIANHYGSFAYQLKEDRLYIVWNFMDLKTDPPLNKFRYWIDRNGNKINIDNLYGKEALYPTLITVIDNNGNFVYNDRTFNALPLEDIQKRNSFKMAVAPSFFVGTNKGVIVLSHTQGIEAKRYKFTKISVR